MHKDNATAMVSKKDIGKLAYAWNNYSEKKLGVLRSVVVRSVYINGPAKVDFSLKGFNCYFRHCELLTKEEIQQYMEKIND